jgi:hypothetical protein
MHSHPLPALPQHLDRLIDGQRTPQASAMVDRWVLYVEAEFASNLVPLFPLDGGNEPA